MAGLLVLFILISSPQEVIVAGPLQPVLSCVQAVLIAQGEKLWRVDQENSTIITAFRLVNPSALRQIAIIHRAAAEIRWLKGRYQLTITLSQAERDGTRVRAVARILGYGESALPLMRPSPWIPLPSTGTLEGDALAAIIAACPPTP